MVSHGKGPPHQRARALEDVLLANHRRFSHIFEHLPAAAESIARPSALRR